MVFHILFHPIWPIVRWGLVMVECRRMRTWMSYQDVGLSWLVLNAGCLSKRWSLLERGKALVYYTKCALIKLTWHRKISLLMHRKGNNYWYLVRTFFEQITLNQINCCFYAQCTVSESCTKSYWRSAPNWRHDTLTWGPMFPDTDSMNFSHFQQCSVYPFPYLECSLGRSPFLELLTYPIITASKAPFRKIWHVATCTFPLSRHF